MAETHPSLARRAMHIALGALTLVACGGGPPRAASRSDTAAVTLPPESGCTMQTYGDHEYWFCPASRTGVQARDLCAAQPWMHLVRVDDVAERDFLESNFSGQVWIGASDETTEGAWLWLDDGDAFWSGNASGSPVGGRYNDWASGEPNNSTGATVPPPTLTQVWDPAHSSITNPVGGCTVHAFGESAYWTCTSLLSWDTARSRCTTATTDLVSITTAAESAFVNNVATGTNEWLIGVQKRGLAGAPNGTWQWLDGGNPLMGFTNWGFAEPGSFDCGAMENDLWKDYSCSNGEAFICEDTSVLPIPDAHGPQLVDLMTANRRFAGSTAALTDGVNATTGCSASPSARDAVFFFSLTSQTQVTIDLSSTTFSSAVVVLFKDTLNAAGYAAAGSRCAPRGSGSTVELNHDLAAGNYYAVITSTSSSGTGTYDITFNGTTEADCAVAEDGPGWKDDICNSASVLRGYVCESDVSDCTVGVDGDDDGVPDCFDGCPEDASHQIEGLCGCPSSPTDQGTSCDDGWCAANIACDGEGNCGSPAQCAPDTNCTYQRLDASGYFFCENARTADEARVQCALQPGMHLVHVDSEAENEFLVENAEDGTWLNATDRNVEGFWTWADDGTQFWQGDFDGSPVAGRFSDWLDDRAPDNLDGLGWPIADCAALETGLPGPVQTHAWSDFACDDARQEFPFTCEMPLAQDCPLESDLDSDGTLDCRDTCPLDANKVVPGDCGCANAPLPNGTACDDGWCAASTTCNAGACGSVAACAPTTGCTPVRHEGKVYWFCTGSHTWTQARDLCRTKAGLELVRIDDGTENAFVTAHVAATSWIGANDRDTNDVWRWAQNPSDNGPQFWSGESSGMPTNGLYSNWAAGEPGTLLAACGQIQTSGTWRDLSCTSTSGFVCETAIDNCGTDPLKFEPGLCGCGVSDVDGDGDGSPNCLDQCASDPNKTLPLWCGCGNAETDSDGDETPNCVDACPNDPGKVTQGICGCGTPDDDSDGDGTLDCQDLCPDDPLKSAPGTCGCDVTDVDTDDDDTPDCVDQCRHDPNKVHPGSCGCGVADVDSDGDVTFDCNDECPNDPEKVVEGQCGCADDPVPSGTACDDGLCPANTECNGEGQCGTYEECSPEPGCVVERVSGRLYFNCPGPLSWSAAESACAGPGFKQLRIDTAAEDTHFDALGTARWLGATDLSEGTFVWQDGSSEAFWSGGPDGMAISGRFSDWGVEQPDDLFGATVYPPAAVLTQLWDQNHASAAKPNGTCSAHTRNAEVYWLCTNVLGWDTARPRCTAVSSNLVSINDAAENAFIVALVGSDDTLIGLQKKALAGAPNGTWQWLDGTFPTGGYSNWGIGEPGSSSCGAIENGVWKDWSCTNLEEWICERPTAPLPIPRVGAPQVVLPYGTQRRFRGNTSGMESGVDGTIMTGCGAGATSPDAVFSFVLTERTLLTIDLAGSGSGARVGIFRNAISAQGFVDAGSECVTTGTLLEESLDAGTYYAVLTGSGSNAVAYEVLFSGVRQGQPGADCVLLQSGKWSDTSCAETYAYTCEVPVDECPGDGSKLEVGLCGCGTPDVDTDGDDTPDCIDECPLDTNQLEPNDCGCASSPRYRGTPCGTGFCSANDSCDGEGRCGDPMDCAPAEGCVFAEYPGMASRGYFFCSGAQSWTAAVTACESQPRMQLARIDDPTENAFIVAEQSAASWIGSNDRVQENQWYWRDEGADQGQGAHFWTGDENGSGVGGLYTNWDPLQPNDFADQDCGEIQASGLWNDDSCTNAHAFVCEIGADLCPDDWSKWEPGVCGCGIPDDDSDGDGVRDCFDSCPYDAARDVPADGHCTFTLVGSSVDRGDRTVIPHAGAVSSDGDVLFVWQALVGDHAEIHGRRFDDNGTPIDWIPLVIDADVGLGWDSEPRVVARPSNGWVVVWTDEDGDDDLSGIAFRIVEGDGDLRGVGTVNDQELFHQWGARAAALDDGFVVTWVDDGTAEGSDGTVLRARRFDGAGRPFGSSIEVAQSDGGDQLTPDVAASGQDWMVVWVDLPTTSVLGRRFAGGVASDELEIATSAHSPAVAALAAPGDFAVSWETASFATYAARVPAGLDADPAARVSLAIDGRLEELPSVVAVDEEFMVAWQYGEGHRDGDFEVVDPLNVVAMLSGEMAVHDLLAGASNQSQVALMRGPSGIWVSWIDDGLGFGEGEAQLAAYFLPAP